MCKSAEVGKIFELEQLNQFLVSLLALNKRKKVRHQTRAEVTPTQNR